MSNYKVSDFKPARGFTLRKAIQALDIICLNLKKANLSVETCIQLNCEKCEYEFLVKHWFAIKAYHGEL